MNVVLLEPVGTAASQDVGGRAVLTIFFPVTPGIARRLYTR